MISKVTYILKVQLMIIQGNYHFIVEGFIVFLLEINLSTFQLNHNYYVIVNIDI